MKLSIIVPMYNTSQWLKRCLDSLNNQGLETQEYEIIVVNDGSTDNSEEVFLEYRKEHPGMNLTLLSQANAGLSAARNAGTRQAQGEYVWWVDSDDFVEPDVILLPRAISWRLKTPILKRRLQAVIQALNLLSLRILAETGK